MATILTTVPPGEKPFQQKLNYENQSSRLIVTMEHPLNKCIHCLTIGKEQSHFSELGNNRHILKK